MKSVNAQSSRFLAIVLATCRLLWLVVILPYSFIKRYRKNSKYDKMLRKRYIEGKKAFDTAGSESYMKVSLKDVLDYGKENHPQFSCRKNG